MSTTGIEIGCRTCGPDANWRLMIIGGPETPDWPVPKGAQMMVFCAVCGKHGFRLRNVAPMVAEGPPATYLVPKSSAPGGIQ